MEQPPLKRLTDSRFDEPLDQGRGSIAHARSTTDSTDFHELMPRTAFPRWPPWSIHSFCRTANMLVCTITLVSWRILRISFVDASTMWDNIRLLICFLRGKLISLALFISPLFCVFFKLEYSRLKNNWLIGLIIPLKII